MDGKQKQLVGLQQRVVVLILTAQHIAYATKATQILIVVCHTAHALLFIIAVRTQE